MLNTAEGDLEAVTFEFSNLTIYKIEILLKLIQVSTCKWRENLRLHE